MAKSAFRTVKVDWRDREIINSWCKSHAMVVGAVLNRMTMVLQKPPSALKHLFSDGDAEEYICYDDVGYHIVKDLQGDGNLDVHAIPGQFVRYNGGIKWKDGRTRLHDEITRRFDEKQSSGIFLLQ